MKAGRMNVETLSKAELLMLLSILEGELEAQDLVIHTLRAQHRDAFVQERYGQYDLSDPFLALQRDSEVLQGRERAQPQDHSHSLRTQVSPNPLAVLKLVMTHCKRMQEKMMAQLATAERRHRRVIADLEEEKRRHAQDTAEGDDVTYMLEKERERLLQQLEFEKSRADRLEQDQQAASGQAQEDLAQQQQISSALAKECQRASARAQEESQRVAQLCEQLEEERSAAQALRVELEAERARALRTEARAERQLAEFDTEQEQLKLKLRKEEKRGKELQELIESLRKELEEIKEREKESQKRAKEEDAEEVKKVKEAPAKEGLTSTACQTEVDGKAATMEPIQRPRLNGYLLRKESESSLDDKTLENGGLENGGGTLGSPVQPHQSLSPSGTACSSLSSSPCSSPVLAKRLASLGSCSPTYPSSYQASVNQRFHAARHKFQQQAEQEQQQQHHQPHSPRDLSPTTTPPPPPENSTAKQIARNTVTQVLSRFTSQQAASKPPTPNSSPFGTDYRTLAASSSSPTGKGPGPLSPGIRSPVIPRSHPPPVPPKKPGINQSPGSPISSSRTSHFPELSGSCGLTSTQEGAKELDLVVSSSS
ncbi:CTTNBP2 N-terminal like b [Astyanax mexicanus]|uniref:CTTNBP2 N-terminal like b n=1 Tax=Astyanax mexicanus TaxID=7994 RepID=A0A8B9REX7_ASTMX|nr:CTTNBP2 N-terminal like b [Astyanax mexicanus]